MSGKFSIMKNLKFLRNLLIPVESAVDGANQGGGLYANLLDAHPPFQIDGNFGATAGIAECLLQSHEECIEFIPAMPKEWKSGYIHGIKSRGNVVVDINWKDGKLTHAKLHIPYNGEMIVRKNSRTMIKGVTCEEEKIPIIEFGKNKIRFQVKSGKTYVLN